MSTKDFTLLPEEQAKIKSSVYAVEKQKLTRLLIHYTLIDSYHKFRAERVPYPFVSAASLRPGSIGETKEHALHNSALVVMVDGHLPPKLRKHCRCRENNRVTKKNLSTIAPDLPGLEHYETNSRYMHHENFGNLLKLLLPLDFSLLIQQPIDEHNNQKDFQLSHFHVKIERLTDSALRSLGVYLNYFQRSLYEHGDEFIDFFEHKFFEYFNFYHNAAGRRSAAALVAQLLARDKLTGTVFLASQQDRRLTLLSSNGQDQNIAIEQYVLLQLNPDELAALKSWGKSTALDIRRHFLVHQHNHGAVVILRLRYGHTKAALPSPDGTLKTSYNIREKWVKLLQEAIVPIHQDELSSIAFPVAYHRNPEEPAVSPTAHGGIVQTNSTETDIG
ncbi:MAG: hypothetical protein HQL58_01520 [Magnetococcales bacterium]|nr:hypothetical protein [Magnetococcales bacterium]